MGEESLNISKLQSKSSLFRMYSVQYILTEFLPIPQLFLRFHFVWYKKDVGDFEIICTEQRES